MRLYRSVFTLVVFIRFALPAFGSTVLTVHDGEDSLCVKSGVLVVLKDSLYITATDTVIPLDERFVRLRKDPYARSKAFYDSLLVKAGSRGFRKELHRLFIKDNNPTVLSRTDEVPREDYFKSYEGKVIRSIRTRRVPVLDGNVNDTSGTAIEGWNRWINLHPQTPEWMARGKGVIRAGDTIRANALADHERLIRELPGIRDARLYIESSTVGDSVDIVVVTQDLFPLRMNIDYRSPDAMRIRLNDRNVTGTGLEAGVEYNSLSVTDGTPDWSFALNQYNLFNRFVDVSLVHSRSSDETGYGFSFNRDFRSGALASIGGADIAYSQKTADALPQDAVQGSADRERKAEAWCGHVFSTESLEWNFVPSVLHAVGQEGQDATWKDQFRRTLYSFTVIRRSYLRSTLVRKYGVSEYIPVGFSLNYTAGPVYDSLGDAWATSASAEWARYFESLGYVSLSWKGGYFTRANQAEDRSYRLRWDYYTPLWQIGRVRYRHLASIGHGQIKDPFRGRWFESSGPWPVTDGVRPSGSQVWRGDLRTVFFMPWYLVGFRFAFYSGIELERFGSGDINSGTGKWYPVFQAGMRMQNDLLTYGDYSFQVSYAPATGIYPAYFSLSFRTFSLPLFDGLKVGKPSTMIN